jgi:P-type Cu+ transporter
VLIVADTIKETSAEAVAQLRALGLRPMLLTGDNERAARAVASEVGIDKVIAEVVPSEKVDVIRRLQSEARVVAKVGDGVNDVAIEARDLTLVRGDLRAAADAIRLSRRTLAMVKGNLSGRSRTTSPPSRSPPLDFSTRCSPARPWRSRACSCSPTAGASGG